MKLVRYEIRNKRDKIIIEKENVSEKEYSVDEYTSVVIHDNKPYLIDSVSLDIDNGIAILYSFDVSYDSKTLVNMVIDAIEDRKQFLEMAVKSWKMKIEDILEQ